MTGTEAQARLDYLYRKHRRRRGGLTPEVVLEDARDPSSPLHDYFTWDDTEAAERWRLSQAETIIRKYKVTIETSPGSTVRVRRFTHIPGENGGRGVYLDTQEALSAPRTREVVMNEARRDLAAFDRKYRNLIDVDAVVRAFLEERDKAGKERVA